MVYKSAYVVLVLLATASYSSAAPQHRRLLQAQTMTPITFTADTASIPQVEATTGLLDKPGLAAKYSAAQPTTIVLQQPVQNGTLPTSTTGGITVETDTPVTVSNVVDVETPQKRIELPQGKGLFGSSDPKTTLLTGLAALASYGNFLANAANAGGSITTAVGTMLNAFLPDCPPYNPNAPPVPGCDLSPEGRKAFLSRFTRPRPGPTVAGPKQAGPAPKTKKP